MCQYDKTMVVKGMFPPERLENKEDFYDKKTLTLIAYVYVLGCKCLGGKCTGGKGLITLCVVSLAVLIFLAFFSHFSSRFEYRVKTRGKREETTRKIETASPTRKIFSILHFALGKNGSLLHFSRVFLAFSRVFLAFLLTNFTKLQPQCIV